MYKDYVSKVLADSNISPTKDLIDFISQQCKKIAVPKNTLHNFKYIPKRDFKTVHENISVAQELTLIIISNLSDTWSKTQNSEDPRTKMGYKRLCSRILEKQVKYNPNLSSPYKKILDLLLQHNYIEVGQPAIYKPGNIGKCTEYRLTRKYFGKGCDPYILQTTEVKRMRNTEFNNNFEKVLRTEIGRNHLKMLTKIQWPSEMLVKETLNQAVKENYSNKKNKRLVWLRKHSKNTYPQKEYIYAEDYFNSFLHLRDNMKMPIIKDEWFREGKLQFRLATCFTLLPSLLRRLITLGDEPIFENDYAALHPNIVQKIYSGTNKEQLTHDKVANHLCISRDVAKLEHLSFFNKRVVDMRKSPLWDYYESKEPLMMESIIHEKSTSPLGHKATCWRVFASEVHLMEECIKRLTQLGVDVIYVYDALYSIKDEQSTVKRIMNEVASEMGFHSKAY